MSEYEYNDQKKKHTQWSNDTKMSLSGTIHNKDLQTQLFYHWCDKLHTNKILIVEGRTYQLRQLKSGFMNFRE